MIGVWWPAAQRGLRYMLTVIKEYVSIITGYSSRRLLLRAKANQSLWRHEDLAPLK